MVELIANKNNSVGLVFGPEKSGLNNDHISLCDFVFKIDANPRFSSLNLSHAVTIICKKIYDNLKKPEVKNNKGDSKIARKSDLMLFYQILEQSLDESNFLRLRKEKRLYFKKSKIYFLKLN